MAGGEGISLLQGFLGMDKGQTKDFCLMILTRFAQRYDRKQRKGGKGDEGSQRDMDDGRFGRLMSVCLRMGRGG